MNAISLENEKNSNDYLEQLSPLYRGLVLALSVCYHSCLFSQAARKDLRLKIEKKFREKLNISDASDWMLAEILKCEHMFLDDIFEHSEKEIKNIAKNAALLENVFMMIVCIDLRIPLFIVGKPGSSKSLAKSIVAGAMLGRNSKSSLFQQLKKAHFVNFQCEFIYFFLFFL